jgi:hypothetical protein
MGVVDKIFIGYFLIVLVVIIIFIFTGELNIGNMFGDSDEIQEDYNILNEANAVNPTPILTITGDHNIAPSGDLAGSENSSVDSFKGNNGRAGEFTAGVYMPSRKGIVTADDQDAFLAMSLAPADTVGKDHGYPVEGLMGGGYIPLPYSSIDGINTNEDLAINI